MCEQEKNKIHPIHNLKEAMIGYGKIYWPFPAKQTFQGVLKPIHLPRNNLKRLWVRDILSSSGFLFCSRTFKYLIICEA